MSMTVDESPSLHVWKTPTGIPIRNLWHMLLYAWKEVSFLHKKEWKYAIETAPSLHALMGCILCDLLRQQLRIGLGRGYVTTARTIRGIRGRIDFPISLKHLTFQNGQAHCRFQEFNPNVAKNQIVRSTLAHLIQSGNLEHPWDKTKELRHEMRRLFRDLEGVDQVKVTGNLIRRTHLDRNDSGYRLMLAMAELIFDQRMPTELANDASVRSLNHDDKRLYTIYESFVANFFRLSLKNWSVRPQVRLKWNAEKSSQYLPRMIPDIVLTNDQLGRMIVLDTKFTAKILIESRNREVFDPKHIYQLYSYLRSQEDISDRHRNAEGILLYPTVNREINETVMLQGHTIRFVTINLALPWQDIESSLRSLVEAA